MNSMSPRQWQAQIQKLFPAWQVWYVPLALGGMAWCARRPGETDLRRTLRAYQPDHLIEYIENAIAEAEMAAPKRP